MLFFFFKQKTAYEMRISDWSSDVCSSDLRVVAEELRLALSQSPETSQLRNQISISPERDGVRISLMDSADRPMFREGTAELYTYARTALAAVTDQLLRGRFRLAIVGSSEERRCGKGGVSTCRYRWAPYL